MLDSLLLIICICIIITLVLYFFYWNRFVGLLLSLVIRFVYWNQGASSCWVEIGSIHFSILAGRILLKDFRYHSSNQTIKIVKGKIAWRYWIRRPTTEEEIGSIRGGEDQKHSTSSSCRLHVTFQGFEWFLYNRTAAYDNIISQMELNEPSGPTIHATERRQSFQKSALADSAFPLYPPSLRRAPFRTPLAVQNALAWVRRQLPSLHPKDLLPIGIAVTRGAIICGNPSTPNLLIAEFQRTEGTFGVVQSRSKYDLYKQILTLRFQHALIRYVQNEDYYDPMTTSGETTQEHIKQHSKLGQSSVYLSYPSFAKLWRQLKIYALTSKMRTNPSANPYQTPTTYHPHKKSKKSLDEETPLGADFTTLEYAVERKILEAPLLELSYYVDVVGEVPILPHRTEHVGVESIEIGNGDIAPEWGIDIVVRGGFLRYGPWADRQRAELQRTFFPPTYHDMEQLPRLNPGDKRVWTYMRIFIELRDNATLHTHFRESSKNWQWDGQSEVPQRPRKREPASIHLTVGDQSSINYLMPMVASSAGYEPVLEVHLDTVEVTSSLNDIRLVTAESCRIRCDLPSPLSWNSQRTWIVAVSLRQPVLYLIRDHINMFTDLVKDWTMSPPNDYHRFIPMLYTFELEMHHFELNMYANDHNIIDKPLIKDQNALVTVRGAHFKHEAKIPSNTFRPEVSMISFCVEAPDVSFGLSLPRWHTHALHAPKEGNYLAKAGVFRIDGSYRYFAEVREENVEQLKLTVTTRDVAFKALGWSIRYFMVLRDNYFGSFTHFSTLYEYLDKRKRGLPIGDPIKQKYREGSANVLQVEMVVSLENGVLVLPSGLPGYETSRFSQDKAPEGVGIGASVFLTIPGLQVQFRLHDYFMEMSLNVDNVSGRIEPNCPEGVTHESYRHKKTKEIFLIDEIDITANRLFGPQPRTATYVCIWEVHLGHIKVILSAADGLILAAAGNAFRLNFADSPNAPAAEYLPPIDPDVTFVKFSLDSFDATWRAGHTALVLAFSNGLNVESNDAGGQFHRKVTSLRLPSASVKVLLANSREGECNRWLEAAELVADGYLDIYSSPCGWRDMAEAQAAFIDEQDRLTGRAKRMFRVFQPHDGTAAGRRMHRNGLYLPQPTLSYLTSPRELVVPPKSPRKTNDEQARPLRWSKLAHLSESDGEEGVSEADRDARLAQTRSGTPIAPWSANENMSSGDESDDEDLTDADSSDSDWSDFADESPDSGGSTKPLLRRYYHITRHYTTHFLDTPSQWDGSPFILIRDYKPLRPPVVHHGSKATPVNEYSFHPNPVTVDLGSNLDTTVFRFECRNCIVIKITPLILPATALLEEQMEMKALSPELFIDSLTASYLGQFSAGKKAEQKTVIDVQLSSVYIRGLQHIKLTDHSANYRKLNEAGDSSCFDIVSVDCFLDGGHLTASNKGCDFGLKVGFDNASITLNVVVDKEINPHDVSNNAVLALSLSTFTASVMQGNTEVFWSEIAARLDHLGPEYITATGVALSDSVQQLADIHRKWKLHTAAMSQSIIYDIIHSSGDKAIIDPLSTIQPSYLVQWGTPHELRTDITFRFLFHLRNCLWHLEGVGRRAFRSLQNDPEMVTMEEVIPLLESRLMSFDADAYHTARFSSVELLLPNLRVPNTRERHLGDLLTFVSIRFQKVAILVLDPLGISSSEFTATHFILATRTRNLDLIQTSTNRPMSISQTSLQDQEHQSVRKISASISLGDISLTVFPHLMRFAQQILRVRRHYSAIVTPSGESVSSKAGDRDVMKSASIDVTFALGRLRVQAAAENLTFEFGTSGVQVGSSMFFRYQGPPEQSMTHSILFDDLFLRARSPADLSKQSDQDILASIILTDGKINTVLRQEQSSNILLRLVFTIGGFQFRVPRSALRLYRFVEEWRADFLPGIEATLQAFLSELHKGPTKSQSPTPSRSAQRYPIFQVQGQITSFGVSLQVMHGTWLSWEVNGTVVYLKSTTTPPRGSTQAFGFQIASQIFSISSKPNAQDIAPSTRARLELPRLSLTGHYDRSCIDSLALFEFFNLKVKPSHWDTLLAVQQKFGHDFNDLVTLIQETRLKGSAPSSQSITPSDKKSWKYNGFLKMRGFRIGLEGLSSTVFLECLDIGGGINNNDGRAWHITLSDLALSLAPRAVIDPRQSTFNRRHRSAFVIIDFRISAGSRGADRLPSEVLQIAMTKIHAVMQPSSIGETGDFIDYLQAEMLDRKEQRAFELAAFKEKTKSILKTFEVKVQDVEPTKKPPWLNNYIIHFSIRNVGVAFPLTHDHDLELPQTGSRDSSAVRAFLFSIKSIEFGTQRGETGQAIMKGFSFQFVSRQSVPTDFSGENHHTRNRLLYPEMTAQLRSDGSYTSRHIWIGANVSGFVLDLDSTVPDYVFSLIDVYRQGKDRVARLSTGLPHASSAAGSDLEIGTISLEKQYGALPTSNVFASLTFLSGKVRVYSGSASNLSRTRSFSHAIHEPSDEQVLEIGAEIFKLPVVSVWGEYRATPALHKLGAGREAEPSTLLFKSTVHSSQNTLRPSLLPFVTELVSLVEVRMRNVSLRTSSPTIPSVSTAVSTQSDIIPDAASSMQISFSLRIDQSKLELTCQPDVNVIAGLHWDSGGFVINVSPGARRVTFSGSVGGLTVGLKHGFLSEDCVKLDARNLAFSVTFAKMEFGPGHSINSVSFVLDTEFLGGVRFSRLQDVLCFKAVWLDRIPMFNGRNATVAKAPSRSSVDVTLDSLISKPEFTTVILIRIRQIKLDVDLGQSIAAVTLDLKDALMRTKLTEVVNEVSLSVADVTVVAKGNLAGRADVSNCVFQTIRRTESSSSDGAGRNRMLELRMTSDALIALLESDHQKLLHYRAEPLEVEIFDDWSMVSPQVQLEDRPLQLSFTVSSPQIVAMVTVGTIPKLLSYTNKFKANLDAQREGASRESKTFSLTRSPKPDNPLSAVANAMLHSARSRFKEAETGLTYVIRQHMSLRLDLLRLVVFPRTMADLEIAQFIGRDVRARLDRVVESETLPAKRDVHLSFSSMTISKFSQLNHTVTADAAASDGNGWLMSILGDAAEAIIVGLPSMNMHMFSEENVDELTKVLLYDFHSQFVRREGMKDFEDIYITLNVSLYSWLTVLRKTLSREMEQVRATANWRKVLTAVPPSNPSFRRKAPAPLQLTDSPKSATVPRPSNQLPGLAPRSFGAAPEQSKSASAVDPLFSQPLRDQPIPSSPPSTSLGFPHPVPDETTVPTDLSMSVKSTGITYQPRSRHIERLTMRQLGEATPDVMHPFFMKKAGFNLEDSLPQYVHEYATGPLEEIMEVLLKIYSRQLLVGNEIE